MGALFLHPPRPCSSLGDSATHGILIEIYQQPRKVREDAFKWGLD